MDLWIKIVIVLLIALFTYREIVKSAINSSNHTPRKKASIFSLISVGVLVSLFTYTGMSITLVETHDLRPYSSPRVTYHPDSIYDKGVINVNGMLIKTNIAPLGELRPLADSLTKGCNGDDGCEAEKLFEFVNHIPYRTDGTSRSPQAVLETDWGDCDDKSNLYASLLNEEGVDYRFVYVPRHVFMVVHVKDTSALPFLSAHLTIDGKDYYYAETTATGTKLGTFNGMFPYKFEGVYDIRSNKNIDLASVKFSML